MKHKLLWFSGLLLIIGIAFGYIEITYYQYLDEKNVLIESVFLPLSMLFVFLGALGVFLFIIRAIWLILKKT
ncbi:hypothetical protein [Shewanella holmiensis]|uniref:DUF3955 domain-containing protein n=1 Tax=Shewanella holmiensis TaxID=2952222 RepID=A0A9X2WK10_9GAMM|nr:hypothetical protein [Shewanella holmiensis]MCT7940616.1 hypothetical protein [Shewanella holmiensis]